MNMISNNFVFSFTNICATVNFLSKLITLGILFSTTVRALFILAFILALRAAAAVA